MAYDRCESLQDVYKRQELGRVKIRTVECGEDAGKVTNIYTYVPGGYGVNSSTPLVWQIMQEKIGFEYEYDTRGNITSEKRGDLTTTYQYDALGQLTRVNDPHENATWVYNYCLLYTSVYPISSASM